MKELSKAAPEHSMERVRGERDRVMSRLKGRNRTARTDMIVDKTQPFGVTIENTRCDGGAVHTEQTRREGEGENKRWMEKFLCTLHSVI